MAVNAIAYFSLTPDSAPSITLEWTTRDGDDQLSLMGIMVRASKKCSGARIGSPDAIIFRPKIPMDETVMIGSNNWLKEVVVYSETRRQTRGLKFVFADGKSVESGDCDWFPKVYRPPPGHFISGVSGNYGRFSMVYGIKFHYQLINKAHPDCHARLPKTEVPPLSDTARVSETLSLASNMDGLHKIISFGVDVHMGGFELTFWENEERKTIAIGPRRTAMKYLTFQGLTNRDDYIIGYWVHKYNDMPIGLRFVTRKGCQLIAGEPGTDVEPHLLGNNLERGAPVRTIISALSAEWSDIHSRKPQMTAFGVVTAGGLPDNCLVEDVVPFNYLAADLSECKDVCLDSNYPVMYIPKIDGLILHKLERLPTFGREQSITTTSHRNGRLYTWKKRVSYLDLSGRIEGIKATTVHQFSNHLPIVAMQVRRHPDDNPDHDRARQTGTTETSFGPTAFNTDLPFDCSSVRTVFRPSAVTSHYSQSDWDAGRQEIKSLRMWTDAKKDQEVAWPCRRGSGNYGVS